MDLIQTSIKRPVTILSVIIMVVMFGLICLERIPYQLSPSVVEPEITVTTTWRGATPYEIEREIIEEQENTLKGLPNLVEMESTSRNGQGSITLKFKVGTDVENALLRVSNKLNEVPAYPTEVDKPVVTASGASASPVVWIIFKTLPNNPQPVETYLTFFENEIRQHLERVRGVSDLFIGGGTEQEMHVIVRPEQMAAYQLTIADLINVLRGENVNVSAGTMGVGRREFRIRTTAEFKTPEEISKVVLRSTGQRRITVSDIATVEFGYAKRTGVVIHNGDNGIALGVRPEAGVNILEMTDNLEQTVNWLNEDKLHPKELHFEWVYDQRFYIRSAIDLIKQNILIGGLLAAGVLLLFLRSVRATLVVGLAIPISIIGTFIMLDLMGRNLNVVSMAGIAFAVGMLVDNAIVVIENIDRHRKMGKNAFEASLEGTKEVWGAVLASTITTLAVFLPVVFIEEEAGQLFQDIAIAVVAAVSLSLLVSISVIPMFANRLLVSAAKKPPRATRHLERAGHRMSDGLMSLVQLATRNWKTRLTTVVILIGLAIASVVFLMPKKEYLPQGNRNLVLSILVPPPGLSVEERTLIGETFFELAAPHINQSRDGLPSIKNMFYVSREGFMLVGAVAGEWDRARELLPLFNRMINSIPGMYGVSLQPGVFQSNLGRGRSVEVDVSGDDLDKIVSAAGALFGQLRQTMPGSQIRPVPSIELTYPEVRIVPDRDRLKANGFSARDFGVALDVLMDGAEIGDFKEEGKKKIDLVVKTAETNILTPEELFAAPLATPQGKIVPVFTLARMEQTTGMDQIRHLERKRTVTLQVTPPVEVPLQQAMETIQDEVLPSLESSGLMRGLEVRLGGAADKLVETANVLKWNFILAAMIAYLLMASMFGNFIYPMIIMLTVPLAGAGGFLGLRLLNVYLSIRGEPAQAMDILTMLGFVILVGVVVNNAILIVHQALNNFRSGMDYQDSVLESTRSRLRPIYMSATTSIFGMLPLVLVPGAGAEMYQGLGSVLLGGLAVSTVFTVFVIPSILIFVIRMEKRPDTKEGMG
ncbi:MAG: efflux RND transporter permease subunit [Deltaproteobacteria bacterium]|jgi:HAE1 family hydrophobic/amphiphilic exporter-1|nr:efflux RND transporter permease subunit [Deltaproteobacteria bacterium]